MRKYWLIFKLNVAQAFIYRATGFIWFWCDFGPTVALLIFWFAAFSTREIIAGYSLAEMLMYYFGVAVVSVIVVPHPQWWLKDQIMNGQFAGIYLLKPVSPFWERMAAQTSWRTIRLLFALPVCIILAQIFSAYLADFSLSLSRLIWFMAALFLAYLGQMFFKICLGLSAIWFGEVGWMTAFWDFSMALFGGGYFPLDIFPQAVQTISLWLPFRYFFYFPLSIFLGRISGEQIWTGFLIQVAWVLIAGMTYRLIFSSGIKKYSAYGS